MAIYHLTCKIGTRSTGANAVAKAAYDSAELLVCGETGQEFDYRRKSGVVHTEILAPEHAPDFARDRQKLWDAVHSVETRKNSQLYRELEIALPHELSREQQKSLTLEFARILVDHGMTVDLAMHAPGPLSSKLNDHAHLLCTTRGFEENGDWSKNKDRSWNDKQLLLDLRETWAAMCNDALEAAGIDQRISEKSLEAQRQDALAAGDHILATTLDRLPEPHLGPSAHAMEVKAKRQAEAAGEAYKPVTKLGQMRQEAVEHRSLLSRLADNLRSAISTVRDLSRTVEASVGDLAQRFGGVFALPSKPDESSVFDLPSKPDESSIFDPPPPKPDEPSGFEPS